MAAFHGQQKHWLRVRADLRLEIKSGLDQESVVCEGRKCSERTDKSLFFENVYSCW